MIHSIPLVPLVGSNNARFKDLRWLGGPWLGQRLTLSSWLDLSPRVKSVWLLVLVFSGVGALLELPSGKPLNI